MQSHVIPVFIWSIATPATITFQNGIPNVVFESPYNVLEPRLTPTLTPPLPTSCIPVCSNLVVHNHSCPVFICWIAYLSSQNTGKRVYLLKIPIFPAVFRSGIRNPLLSPTQYVWPWLTPHQPLFAYCHYQLQIKSDLKWCIHLSKSLYVFQLLGECHCWWTKESPRAYVAKFFGRLRLIRSVLRASKFSVFKIDWNCNFVGLLHHPFWLQLI